MLDLWSWKWKCGDSNETNNCTFTYVRCWHFRKVDYKCLESFEMWCWTGMKKISLIDIVKNEVLCTVKEERNILHTIKERKANWIGHILYTNSLLKHVNEGMIEGTGRQGRRCKNLLYDLTEKRRYWKLKQEAVDHTGSRTCFGRCYRPVIRQTTVSLFLSAHENNSWVH